jgi:ribonuclease-3 family protein
VEQFFDVFRRQMEIESVDIRTYSPLALAFIGDSIYDCMVKLFLVGQGNRSVNELQKQTKQYVKASEQARILLNIEPMLSEEELRIVKWGRNAKSQTIPKNAIKADYQMATSLECLFGYLLLNKDYDRLIECVVEGMKHD